MYNSPEYQHHYGSKHKTESPPDSAVDMDSASIQSSPSENVQTLTLWPLSDGGFVNEVLDMKLKTIAKEEQGNTSLELVTDADSHQMADVSMMSPGSSANKDSDVDSGIAHSDNSHNQHNYNSPNHHGLHHVSKSLSSNKERQNTNRSYNSVNGQILLPTSSSVKHTFRTQQTRLHTPRRENSKPRPLKADHSIQPVNSPTQHRHNYDMEKWLAQGARPKCFNRESYKDQNPPNQNGKRSQSAPRDSPPTRVHFLDETLEMDYLAETLELKGDIQNLNRKYMSDYLKDVTMEEDYRPLHYSRRHNHAGVKKEKYPQKTNMARMQIDPPAGMEQHYAHRVTIDKAQLSGSKVRTSVKEVKADSLDDSRIETTSLRNRNKDLDSDCNSMLSESNTETESMVVGISEKKPWQPLAHSAAVDYWSSSCEDLAMVDTRKQRAQKFRIWKRNRGQYAPHREMEKQAKETHSQAKSTYVRRPQTIAKSASTGNLYNVTPHPPTQPRASPKMVRKRPSSATAKMKSPASRSCDIQDTVPGNMAEDLIAERNRRVEELFRNYTGLDISAVEKSYQNRADTDVPDLQKNKSMCVNRHYNSMSDLRSRKTKMVVDEIDGGKPNAEQRNQRLTRQAHSMDDVRLQNRLGSEYIQGSDDQNLEKEPCTNNPCITTNHDDSIRQIDVPPEVRRGNISDLEKHRDLSGSRTSLSDRMDSFRESAKRKFNKLRKAVSLERLDQGNLSDKEKEEKKTKLKKSSSLRSLKNLFRKKDTDSSMERDERSSDVHRTIQVTSSTMRVNGRPQSPINTVSGVENPRHFRPIGKLRRINPDGTQLIELIKPPHGPFGFYIARGNKKYNHGVFISRMSDGHPEKFLAGLLGVGDEILEINNITVKTLTLDAVYDLMAQTPTMLLKTLPFLARKDF